MILRENKVQASQGRSVVVCKPCRKYMKVRYLKSFKTCERSTTFCLVAILGVLSLSWQQCRAQQSSLDSSMFLSGSSVNWISGPQSLSVGDYADIQIPQGYRWVDGQAARTVLESQNNPVPADLIGVIAPDSGKWWAVVEFSPKGYLKDPKQFSSAVAVKYAETALNDQWTRQGLSPITSLDWQSKPVYDPQGNSLSWSLQVQTASTKAMDQTIVLLGRHGILQITAVQPYPFTDAPSLKQLASNVAFKDGERYTDYQSGDKIASIGMAELITGENEANTAGIFSHGFTGAAAALVYAGLGACVLVGLVVVTRRKKHRRPARMPAGAAVASNSVPAHGSNGSNGSSASKNAQPAAPAMAKVALNQGQTKELKHPARSRRKKVFNYPKFYTNVMRELSLHSYGPGIPVANGKSSSNGHHNGHANGGHANGHSNASNGSNGHANSTNGANGSSGANGVNDAIKAEIVELIATQKNLIQEQKNLLEQQTRLIEEKRWLIEEQTAFLKGQADQYPLKFE
jgi:uncharacterized membrane-anchored protein